MFRRKKFKFTFHKRWLEGRDNEHYKLITDSEICSQTIEYAQAYNLDIKTISLSNLHKCVIVLKGDRNDYLYFVRKFVEGNSNYIEQIYF